MVKRKATSPHRARNFKHTKASPRRSSLAVKRNCSAEEERPVKRVHFADADGELSKDLCEHQPKRTLKKLVAAKATSRVVRKPQPPTRIQPERGATKTLPGNQLDSPTTTSRAAVKRKRVPSTQVLTAGAAGTQTGTPQVKRPRGRPRKEPKKPQFEPVKVYGGTEKSSENGNHDVNGPHQQQVAEVLITAQPADDSPGPRTSTPIRQIKVPAGESLAKNHNQITRPCLKNGSISLSSQQDRTSLPTSTQNAPALATGHPNSLRQAQAVSTTVSVSAAEDLRIWSVKGVPPADDPCLTLALRHLELGISTWRQVDLVEEIRLSEGILHARSGAGYEWERRYEKRLDIE